MVLVIAHRGNTHGRVPARENSPSYIDEALQLPVEVEVDLWAFDGNFWLGHDVSEYRVSAAWLQARSRRLWVHCKNLEALRESLRRGWHAFFHQTDDYVLTSHGIIWAFPGKPVTAGCVTVVRPGTDVEGNIDTLFGVCTDDVRPFLSETQSLPEDHTKHM